MNQEFPFDRYSETATDVRHVDEAIAAQNNRFEQTVEITDEDFKQIALEGLYHEQQASIDDRRAAAESIDYHAVARQMLADEAKQQTFAERETVLSAAIEAVERQAAVSLRVSPTSEALIHQLTDKKRAPLVAELATIAKHKAELASREAGYIAIGAAWTIPRVPIISKIESSSADPEHNTASIAVSTPESIGATELTAEAANTQAETETSTANLDVVLASVMWAVYDYAENHVEQGVRVEEMRREVPELAQLSEVEYKYFKAEFTGLRELIVQKLSTKGIAVTWDVTGQTRGTRYHLYTRNITGFVSPTTQTRVTSLHEAQHETALKTAQTKRDTELETSADVSGLKAEKALETESTSLDDLRNIPFVKTVLDTISRLQQERDVESLKRTLLVRELSAGLGIDTADVGFFLSEFIRAGLIHERGHSKGTKLLSTLPATSSTEDTAVGTEPKTPESSERSLPRLPDNSQQSNSERAKAPELPLAIVKSTIGRGNRRLNVVEEVTLEDTLKQFGIKNDNGLEREVEKMIRWLVKDPYTIGTQRLKSGRRSISLDHQSLALYKFSPDACVGLSIKPDYRYYRIVYGTQDGKLILVDILPHDKFDKKYP